MVASTRAARLHRRADGVHVVMLVVGVLGAVVTLALMQDDRVDTSIAVAGRALLPGDRIRSTDVEFVAVELPAALERVWITPAERVRWRDVIVTGRVEQGEPLRRGALAPEAGAAGRRSMSIPIDPSRAVNGRLRVGDRVDVVVAGERDVAIVAWDLEVLDVFDGRRGAFGSTSRAFSVTLAVDAQQSLVLTAALADGDLVLTRVTGAPSGRDVAPLPIAWVNARDD